MMSRKSSKGNMSVMARVRGRRALKGGHFVAFRIDFRGLRTGPSIGDCCGLHTGLPISVS